MPRPFAVAALIASTLPAAFAEPSVDIETRCFQVVGQPARLVQLRLIDTRDGNSAAFVHYAGSESWIPLVLGHRKLVPMADSDRAQVDTEWLEVVDAQVSGRYVLSTLGAEVVSFDYLNRKSGRHTAFTPAPTPRGVDPCGAH